jgi:hypothetical protein
VPDTVQSLSHGLPGAVKLLLRPAYISVGVHLIQLEVLDGHAYGVGGMIVQVPGQPRQLGAMRVADALDMNAV